MAENKFEQEPISAPDLIWVMPTPKTKEKGKLVPITGKKAFMLSCYGWEVREEHVFLSNFRAEIRLCLLVQGHDSVLEQSTTCSHRSVLESPLSVWQKHPQCVTGKQELLLRLIEYVVSLFWIREKLAISWLNGWKSSDKNYWVLKPEFQTVSSERISYCYDNVLGVPNVGEYPL